MSQSNSETIAAIATAAQKAAIGIVRITGNEAAGILKKIFKPKRAFESHRMHYGLIEHEGVVIDEVMACLMLAPKTYTCEDTVEIYAHGGMFVLGRVLETVLKCGARPARPGEFTERAFLNGRISLNEAEAVMDIISAKSEAARREGLRQLGGSLTYRISAVREKLLTWIAHIELSIDYPEHEEEANNRSQVLEEAPAVVDELAALLETASVGRIM